MGHLKEDVGNPCSAAHDLPREERLRHLNKFRSAVPERGREKERHRDSQVISALV